MNTSLHVLIVEDMELDALLAVAELERAGHVVNHERVDSEATLRAALARQDWDLILCDFSLPGFSGSEALRVAKEMAGDVPFIFVSGTIGEAAVVEAMRSGAQDYVMKDRISRLAPAVARELREAGVRREAKMADQWMRESEHKYRQLFEALHEAVFVIEEKTGRIIDANPQAESLLQRTRTEIVGANQSAFFAPRAGVPALEALQHSSANRGRSGVVLSLMRRDGATQLVHASASRSELYGRALLLVLMHAWMERR